VAVGYPHDSSTSQTLCCGRMTSAEDCYWLWLLESSGYPTCEATSGQGGSRCQPWNNLAIIEPVARLIVKVKRLRSRAVRLESISTAARNGKIYPLFNQIKSRTGVVATNGPSLFDIEGPSELKSCFDGRVRDLFVDAKTSLHILAEVTKDPVLTKVGKSKSKVDPVIAKHPLMQELDPDELLLRLAVGQSDTASSKRFLVDRSKIATMRHDLEKRYQAMFQWLNSFRRVARAKRYATNGDLRKYIDGLKSSDVARREQALEYAVRWLIRY
jgi:DNA polymerase I-like protein with 3'-5' exonuclease and polymerase domains